MSGKYDCRAFDSISSRSGFEGLKHAQNPSGAALTPAQPTSGGPVALPAGSSLRCSTPEQCEPLRVNPRPTGRGCQILHVPSYVLAGATMLNAAGEAGPGSGRSASGPAGWPTPAVAVGG